MKPTIDSVYQFQVACGVSPPEIAALPVERTVWLRLHLLTEELSELQHGLCSGDRVEQIDALADLRYVLDGAVIEYGCRVAWGMTSRHILPRPESYHTPLAIVGAFYFVLGQLARSKDALEAFNNLHDLDLNLRMLGRSLGFDDDLLREAFDEVHSSNMSKVGPDGVMETNGSGRVLKGPGYRRPDLARVLADWEAAEPTRAAVAG